MKTPQHRHDSAADEQAALWAARLDGDTVDGEQRAALEQWLAEDPSHRALLSHYCQFSADLEEQVPALVSAGAVSMPVVPQRPRRSFWSLPRLGTVLAAAAAIAMTVIVLRPADNVQNFATSPAQRSLYTLADGTRIELNAHTSIRFENDRDKRLVRLASGEALFHVAKDPTRPFIVETPSGTVRVTGTTFNVRNDGPTIALEVTVVEGSVLVWSTSPGSDSPIALTGGDQLSLTASGSATKRELSGNAIEDVLAWRDGLIVFDNVPLHEVAARLARHHGKRIDVASSVAHKSVGGRFGLDDFDAFAEALAGALNVRITQEPSGAVNIGPRPAK